MSGHSKWSTIKRSKGIEDVKRGLTFTKVANAITIAAKLGGSGDVESNPRLRAILEEAKTVNMPKDNIQRAIDRGLGKLPGQMIEEVIFEGFGPGKVAFYVEGITDNRLRTLQLIKNLFDKNGGHLAGQGAVAYMFDKKGEIKVISKARLSAPEVADNGGQGNNKDDEMLELIDLGAEDVLELSGNGIQGYLVYTQSPELITMGNKITQAGFEIDSQELIMKPNITVEIKDPEVAKKVLEFSERLEEQDDIQKVFANFEISG